MSCSKNVTKTLNIKSFFKRERDFFKYRLALFNKANNNFFLGGGEFTSHRFKFKTVYAKGLIPNEITLRDYVIL